MTDDRIIVCGQCESLNRASAARLEAGERPNCGRCHAPLFDGHPADLRTAESFDRLIGKSGIPVLVDFWAEWCGPCRQMAPHFAAAARDLEPRFRLAKLDTEAAADVSGRFGIRGIPTMILFSGGKELARQSGATNCDGVVRFARQYA